MKLWVIARAGDEFERVDLPVLLVLFELRRTFRLPFIHRLMHGESPPPGRVSANCLPDHDGREVATPGAITGIAPTAPRAPARPGGEQRRTLCTCHLPCFFPCMQ